MKKNLIVLTAVLMTILAAINTYAAKETPNYLKGCSVSGCRHSRSGNSTYCSKHKCAVYSCNSKRASGDKYCSLHTGTTAKNIKENGVSVAKADKYHSSEENYQSYKSGRSSSSGSKTPKYYSGSSKSKNLSASKKSYDTYDVYGYKDADSFADDKYEEFFDYEDYEDEDEAYDAAVDYWNGNRSGYMGCRKEGGSGSAETNKSNIEKC